MPRVRGRTGWVWGVALLVASVLLVLSLRSAGIASVANALSGLRLSWVLAGLVGNFLILFLWALAWQRIVPAAERGSYPRMLEVVSLTAMAMNTLPLPLGHRSGTVALTKHGKVGNAGALSVLATHEVAEGLAKIAVLLLVGTLAPLPLWMRRGSLALALGAGGLGGVLFLIARFKENSADLRSSSGVLGLLEKGVASLARKLEVMKGGRGFPQLLGLILAMKASEAGAILCAQHALGVELPLTTLPGVLGAIMLASMVPLVPGNLGTYEAGAYFIYLQLGIPPGTAMALALVQHVLLLGAFLGAGCAVLLRRSILEYARTGEKMPARSLRAFGFWIRYLLFSVFAGLLALRRSTGNRRERAGR